MCLWWWRLHWVDEWERISIIRYWRRKKYDGNVQTILNTLRWIRNEGESKLRIQIDGFWCSVAEKNTKSCIFLWRERSFVFHSSFIRMETIRFLWLFEFMDFQSKHLPWVKRQFSNWTEIYCLVFQIAIAIKFTCTASNSIQRYVRFKLYFIWNEMVECIKYNE